MKKVYEKPMILFEDFTINVNIAGDCENVIDTQTRNTCGIGGTGEITVFLEGVNGCDIPMGDGDSNYPCYHVPDEGNNLFNS